MASRTTRKSKTSRKPTRRLLPISALLEERFAGLRTKAEQLLVKSPVRDLAEFARQLPVPRFWSKSARTGEKRRRINNVLANLPTASQWKKLRAKALTEVKGALSRLGEEVDRRLQIPSRRDIQRLTSQIAALEKRLDSVQGSPTNSTLLEDSVEVHHA